MSIDLRTQASDLSLTTGVTRVVLDNGLTLLVKENHSAAVAALLVSIRAGYFNERDEVSGIAHVIEHMMFKGTPVRPDGEQFAREIRELGGTLNAATYYEETYYYVIVPAQNYARAFEIQSDALQNAMFDAAELEKEIEVIVQESLQKRDSPAAMLNETLYEMAFDTHRIRRWRIGHPEALRTLKRENLVQFVQETYRPENMVVSIVGDVDTDTVIELVRNTWGDVHRGELLRAVSPVEPARTEFRYRRLLGDHNQRLLLFVLPAVPILHGDGPALLVLSAILSDGRSARLFRRLKEELRIANSAWATYESFEQMGLFKFGAESIADDPLTVHQAIWREIRRIQDTPPLDSELERVKTRIESSRLFSQEEVFGMARTLATYELLGDYRLADAFAHRLHAVTAADVQRVAITYLSLSNASLLEYLPKDLSVPRRVTPELEHEILSAIDDEQTNRDAAIDADTTSAAHETEHPSSSARKTAANALIRSESPEQVRLSNGATLVYKARRDLPIIAVQTLFRGGKSLENRGSCGLTSLMLKASMKGTRSWSAEQIAERIEAIGSGIGVSPGPDHFSYGFKVRRSELREAFRLFAEVIGFPTFPDSEIDGEKQGVFGELRRQQDSSMSLAYEQFAAAYFGDHPYGLPPIGIEDSVAALNGDALRAWHRSLVTPTNMVATVVGDIDLNEAIDLLEGLLTDADRSEPPSPVAFGGPPPASERAIDRQKKQTAAALGFTGAKLASDDRYALDLLDEVTSSMGGRFFRAVRGENALAYSVSSVHRSRVDAGNFITYTSTAPENEIRARDILLKECARLGTEPIPQREIDTARATLVGEHVIGTQTFGAQASELGYYALHGLPLDEAQRYLARIGSVSAEELMAAAERYLTPDNYWLGVVRGTGD